MVNPITSSQHADCPAPATSKLVRMLAAAAWAQGLTLPQRQRVERETFSRFYPKGSHVFHEGETVDYWIGIVDGLAKMSSASPHGQTTSFVAVGTGAWVGEGSLIRKTPRRYGGVVLRDSELAFIPRETFMLLLDTSIDFNRFIINQLNERLFQFVGLARRDRLMNPEARVALSLASVFNPLLSPGMESALGISQDEIAALAGLSRQRTNEALKVLEQKGLLQIERVGVTILDLDALENYVAG